MENEAGAGGRDAGTVILHLITGACLLFAVGLIASNIHPTRKKLEEMRDQRARIEEEIRRKRAELEYLSMRGDALESDPYSIEREAREALGVTREGEKIIRFEDED